MDLLVSKSSSSLDYFPFKVVRDCRLGDRRPAKTLVFIDSGVDDYEVLRDGVLPGAVTFVLDAEEDGILQITRALDAYSDVRNIHIVSHGNPGILYLGSSQLNLNTIEAYHPSLQKWADALASDAQILLYGCRVAEGVDGLTFVHHLHEVVGRAIAASTTPIGHASQDGNWHLDVITEPMEIALPFTTATLETFTGVLAGEVIFSVNLGIDDIQQSNFTKNSFLVTNIGDLAITNIEIDVTGALYPDSVFDPTGEAGDTASKELTIDSEGGTGFVSSTYVGAGGTTGYEGLTLEFSNFNPGESVGFSIDMDPNSITGSTKSTLDAGSDPFWDVGGVSGAELIGSLITVTFEDGSTATGQLMSDGTLAGSQALISQASPNLSVSLTINGLAAGEVGDYGSNGPSVIINGPAGQTARIVLTKGFIQPVTNLFDEPYASQLDAQLAALAAQDFPANNAVEFQIVDVLLTGENQDISSLFNFSGVADYNFAGEDQLPLGFVASVIDPSNQNLPLGPVSQPIYLAYEDLIGPTASVAAPNVVSSDSGLISYSFTVDYSDVNGIDLSTLDSNDVVVTGPNGYSATATLTGSTTANGVVTATYEVIPPGGSWDEADDGTYTVTVQAGSVTDTNANPIAEVQATFDVALSPASDTTVPTAVITASEVSTTVAGETLYTFSVAYSDDFAVDETSLDNNDVVVTGPNGYSVAATLTGSTTANGVVTATYEVTPPGGSWDEADDGTYTITVQAGSVTDTNANPIAEVQATFEAALSQPQATPGLRINVGGDAYTDSLGNEWLADQYFFRGNLLSTSDTIANTEDDFIYQSGREASRTNKSFFYNIPVENGTYDLNLLFAEIKWATSGERVFDVLVEGQLLQDNLDVIAQVGSNNAAYQVLFQDITVADGFLDIEFSPEANKSMVSGIEVLSSAIDPADDTSAPIAIITAPAVALTDSGATAYTFTVEFADNVAIDTSTLDNTDAVVTGPNGYSAAATLVSTTTTNGVVTATYEVIPPGGSWDEADDGTYTVTVQAGSVTDTNANPIAEVQSTFDVTLAPASDTTAPIAVITASEVSPTAAGEMLYTFSVAYSDDFAVDETTLDDNDVVVTGPNGYSAAATLVSTTTANGVVTATYEVTPPGGSWDEADDGTYTVTVQAGSVTDTNANPIAEVQATFEAALSQPQATPGLRINVGGDAYTDSLGNEWLADQYFFRGNLLSTSDTIANTEDDFIYQSGRESSRTNKSFFYNIPVENGTYDLNLLFAEIKWATSGERVFDVLVEGQLLQDNLDVIAQVGSNNAAYQVLFQDITVADGFLDIEFSPEANKSMVSGIEVLSSAIDPADDTSAPTASITAPAVALTDSGATAYTFTVEFADNVAIDTSTLDDTDAVVTGPNGYSAAATLVSTTTTNGVVTAIYEVIPPGGSWDEADDGTYTVTVQAGSVTDTNANPIAEVQSTFDVTLSSTVQPGTALRINAGGTAYTDNFGNLWEADQYFTGGVIYTAATEIAGTEDDPIYQTERYGDFSYSIPVFSDFYDLNLLFAEIFFGSTNERVFDITVEGQLVQDNLDIFAQAGSATAYQLNLSDIAVTDGFLDISFTSEIDNAKLSGIEVLSGTSDPGNDTIAPTAIITASDVSTTAAGETSYTFSVAYSDNFAVDASTLDGNDVVVTGPNGYSAAATLVSTTTTNGVVTATYEVIPPGGSWDEADDGTYTVTVQAGSVTDTNANPIAEVQSTFDVTLAPASDTTAPTAVITASEVSPTAAGETLYTFSVAYSDDFAVDETTLDNNDVVVTGPNGYSAAANLVATTTTNGVVTATYEVTPPGGNWDEADDGTYTITVQAGSVTDTNANPIAEVQATFEAALSATVQPVATLRINAGGGAYTDSFGNLWESDASYIDKGVAKSTTDEIFKTEDDPIYQSYRESKNSSIRTRFFIPVDNGNYSLNLHFSENEFENFGIRTFDIFAEGVQLFDELDVFAKSKNAFFPGKNSALVLNFQDIGVSDGILDLDLLDSAEKAMISGIEVIPIVGPQIILRQSENSTRVTEGGNSDSYEIVLNTAPAEVVTIQLQLDDQQLSSDVSSLIFTPENWNVPQTVTINAVDDTLKEGTETYSISHAVTSLDPDYDNRDVADVAVTITDNDVAVIDFTEKTVASMTAPTRGTWGPDGRLYVGSYGGQINAYTFDDNYNVVSVQTIDALIGSESPNILGIAFNPFSTSDEPEIYVSHSLLYANGGGSFPETELSPYSGQVSVLSGADFSTVTPLITGLPVSNHDHGINGLEFDDQGNLLIAIGGNTNAGIANDNIGGIPESPFSAAILKAEITKPDFNGVVQYSLPGDFVPPDGLTFSPEDSQTWGDIADVVPGVDVSVYAYGLRNPFDLVWTTQGQLYATDNGANTGFGDVSTSATTQEPFLENVPDELNLIVEGNYYGHPNRNLGRYDDRLNVYYSYLDESIPGVYTAPIGTASASTNGIEEYRATTFEGQLRGRLLAQQWNNVLHSFELAPDGQSVVQQETFGITDALDIVTGPGGAIVGIDLSENSITVALPNDLTAQGLQAYDIFPWRAPAVGGREFVIGGTGFGDLNNTTVSFEGTLAEITYVSGSRIRGIFPTLNLTGDLLDVTISSGGQASTITDAFLALG